jgi:hypothetical protein
VIRAGHAYGQNFHRDHDEISVSDRSDTKIACASGVILEDQKRPRRCGHADGKQVLALEEYLEKLDLVLQTREDLLVVARTDATEESEILRRAAAMAATDADADREWCLACQDLDWIAAAGPRVCGERAGPTRGHRWQRTGFIDRRRSAASSRSCRPQPTGVELSLLSSLGW